MQSSSFLFLTSLTLLTKLVNKATKIANVAFATDKISIYCYYEVADVDL